MNSDSARKTVLERTRKAVILTVGRSEQKDHGSSTVELSRALTASNHELLHIRQAVCDLAQEGHLFSVATHGLPPPPPNDRDFDSKVVGLGLTASGRELLSRYSISPLDRIMRTLGLRRGQ